MIDRPDAATRDEWATILGMGYTTLGSGIPADLRQRIVASVNATYQDLASRVAWIPQSEQWLSTVTWINGQRITGSDEYLLLLPTISPPADFLTSQDRKDLWLALGRDISQLRVAMSQPWADAGKREVALAQAAARRADLVYRLALALASPLRVAERFALSPVTGLALLGAALAYLVLRKH